MVKSSHGDPEQSNRPDAMFSTEPRILFGWRSRGPGRAEVLAKWVVMLQAWEIPALDTFLGPA